MGARRRGGGGRCDPGRRKTLKGVQAMDGKRITIPFGIAIFTVGSVDALNDGRCFFLKKTAKWGERSGGRWMTGDKVRVCFVLLTCFLVVEIEIEKRLI